MDDQKLINHIRSELKDVQEYVHMYHESDDGVFYDLAEEEMSHARLLKNELMIHGNHDTAAFHDEWMKAVEALNE